MAEGRVQQVIDTKVSLPLPSPLRKREAVLDRHSQQAFGNGHLSEEQANPHPHHLPYGDYLVNKDDIFQYIQ